MLATAELADPATMEAVVDALVRARRVQLIGIGASGLVAMDMAQKLTRIGMWCHASTSEDDALVQASLLEVGDVVIAFSHSGETTRHGRTAPPPNTSTSNSSWQTSTSGKRSH
jgi:DNA-binding MurR/RpiR family transcriptional regulator